jgi:Zn finger protein HypA/HybF involved in hydrogenase expression
MISELKFANDNEDITMGAAVTATCSCGLEASILIGGGMSNFMDICYFPCQCARCKKVVQVNLLAKRQRCPTCRANQPVPYDDPSLTDGSGSNEITSWNIAENLGRTLKLTDSHYHCPQCGQMTLRFQNAGLCWD